MTATIEAAAPARRPTGVAGDLPDPGVVDRIQYLQTLDQVEAGLDRLHQLLHRSRRAPAGARGQRLTDLHTALRALGQVLNDAQGGWPPPPPEDEAA
ncbi:hypothetical protein [Dactylosporangium sp. NPDC048998]|uniref:hypothetical protein n=1 Tax=Dactylosporangium sp. NPDC048998 TaxID=3363976 RepID=UPI00371ED97A